MSNINEVITGDNLRWRIEQLYSTIGKTKTSSGPATLHECSHHSLVLTLSLRALSLLNHAPPSQIIRHHALYYGKNQTIRWYYRISDHGLKDAKETVEEVLKRVGRE